MVHCQYCLLIYGLYRAFYIHYSSLYDLIRDFKFQKFESFISSNTVIHVHIYAIFSILEVCMDIYDKKKRNNL